MGLGLGTMEIWDGLGQNLEIGTWDCDGTWDREKNWNLELGLKLELETDHSQEDYINVR
jgi:hypothetical protein